MFFVFLFVWFFLYKIIVVHRTFKSWIVLFKGQTLAVVVQTWIVPAFVIMFDVY